MVGYIPLSIYLKLRDQHYLLNAQAMVPKALDSRKNIYTVKRPLTDIGYLSSN